MKSFFEYCTDFCWVVKTPLSPLGKPFVLEKEANEYYKKLHVRNENPTKELIEIINLDKHLVPSDYISFMKKYKKIYKKDI